MPHSDDVTDLIVIWYKTFLSNRSETDNFQTGSEARQSLTATFLDSRPFVVYRPAKKFPIAFIPLPATPDVAMSPRVSQERFCNNGAPLPSTGSARAAFPGVISTIRALRLPMPNTESLISIRFSAPVLVSSFASLRPRPPQDLAPRKPGYH